ncbi:uncharacterized protein B0I36DRAFT_325016 [Microdochium trichocladiopsis]|uniref:Uncharacterized protein n=1 Tax=Microdochium trichocladiopsis TaxID=1682393 RepID=A0A9P8Y628_9PEZI|nr:uncharacterized protein B0I36DRAFT_325016 [Microdochium trichocladiopsis]KAH7029083.1 hypothetical protein B0I36DRAFT_325016 [Microdochium trichocladiopsis]
MAAWPKLRLLEVRPVLFAVSGGFVGPLRCIATPHLPPLGTNRGLRLSYRRQHPAKVGMGRSMTMQPIAGSPVPSCRHNGDRVCAPAARPPFATIVGRSRVGQESPAMF